MNPQFRKVILKVSFTIMAKGYNPVADSAIVALEAVGHILVVIVVWRETLTGSWIAEVTVTAPMTH